MKIYHLETKNKRGEYSTIGYFVDINIANDYKVAIGNASGGLITTRITEIDVNANRKEFNYEDQMCND